VLGRVYGYFLGKFAAAEGRNAGEFYTPRSVVRLLVEMLEPFEGRVYDPCCGSGGMFVQSSEFVAAHGGRREELSIYGQEFVATTRHLAKMNLLPELLSGRLRLPPGRGGPCLGDLTPLRSTVSGPRRLVVDGRTARDHDPQSLDGARFAARSPLGERLAAKRDEVLALAARRHASNVRVFGRVVRALTVLAATSTSWSTCRLTHARSISSSWSAIWRRCSG
jgi:hypothetical protein